MLARVPENGALMEGRALALVGSAMSKNTSSRNSSPADHCGVCAVAYITTQVD